MRQAAGATVQGPTWRLARNALGPESDLPELASPGIHEQLVQTILHLPGIGADTPILDLGCGSGAWLLRLARHGFRNLHGVDNQSFVSMPALPVPFSCSAADLDNDPVLGLGEAKFGLVTAIEVIEHLHNPGVLLSHVSRHLSGDGYFLLTTPNLHSVRARVRFALTGKLAGFDPTNAPAEPTHLYPVFITCLDRLLPRYGLKTLDRWTLAPGPRKSSRVLARSAAMLLRCVLPDEYPGDTLCLLVGRA
jgi:SAM-dependent methyltransferase